MSCSTSNLSVDEQQAAAAVAAAATKRKEDDAAAAAQAAVVAAARKTLDEAWVRKRATTLAWEKEKTITCHLEQQLAAAQGITIRQDDDDDRSIDVGSNPDATLTAHLHA
jgi:hypothetical protein